VIIDNVPIQPPARCKITTTVGDLTNAEQSFILMEAKPAVDHALPAIQHAESSYDPDRYSESLHADNTIGLTIGETDTILDNNESSLLLDLNTSINSSVIVVDSRKPPLSSAFKARNITFADTTANDTTLMDATYEQFSLASLEYMQRHGLM
jgi:hypothetical protein